MARIEIPRDRQLGGFQSIDPTSGARAAASGAEIGRVIAAEGAEIARVGQQYFNEARDAIDESIFNNAFSKASLEYNELVQARINTPYDDHGNPTFETLVSDIGKIGQEVQTKYLSGIASVPVRDKFLQTFTDLQLSKQTLGLQYARNQQLDFSMASLEQGLKSISSNALKDDPVNIPMYFNLGKEQINSALRSGYISAQTAEKLRDDLRKEMYYETLSLSSRFDPKTVSELLQRDSSELNLTEQEKLALKLQNDADIRTHEARARQQEADVIAQEKKMQEFNKDELSLSLLQGVATEGDVEKAYQDGKISHTQRTSLLTSLLKSQGASLKKSQTRIQISDSVSQGEILDRYSQSEINDHYQSRVASLSGQNVMMAKNPAGATLLQRAVIASDYKAPVTAFTQEIEYLIKAGSPEQVIEAVKAYEFVNSNQPIATSNIDSKSLAFLSMVSSSLAYTKLSPAQAVEIAKSSVFNADTSIRDLRVKQFNKEESFKATELQKTISDMYGAGGFFKESIDPSLVPVVGDLLKEAYALTGNSSAAIEMVKKQTAGLIGQSEVNQISGFFRNKNVVMYGPPELVFPQIPPEALRQDLEQSVQAVLPDGISPKQILIQSNKTLGLGRYAVYYLDEDGAALPLVNPENGQVQIWVPDIQGQRDMQLQKAVEKREAVIREGAAVPTKALELLRDFEGFSQSTYWDVNAFRLGYGSDTITRENGKVEKVRRGMRVSKVEAELDLKRRAEEFRQVAVSQVGKDAWNALPANAQSALISITYNYGSLPARIIPAIKTGNVKEIAAAVRRLGSDNRGINRRRRNKEADLILKAD